MVSSGVISSDISSLKSSFSKYDDYVSSLASSWKGLSYDNFVTKASTFSSTYLNTVSNQMNALSNACSLYQEYISVKSNLNRAESLYNQAVSNNDSSASNYRNDVYNFTSSLNNLKSRIEEELSIAKGSVLEGSSPNYNSSSSSSFNTGASLGIDSGIYGNKFTSSAGKNMNYYAYVPNNATEGMPLIVYLHGDGSVGNYAGLKNGEMAKCVFNTYGDDYPFIFLQPNTEIRSWTENGRLDTLAELIQNVAEEYHCDPNKIILSGGSRGGNGAWAMANKYSDMFSAFVPISGISSIDASNFTSLPTLAVSTPTSSDSWNYSGMQSNVNQINNAGGNATFVSLDGYNHNTVLSGTFTEDMFNWMISQ